MDKGKLLIVVTAVIGLAGCGTFQLSSGAIPNSPKTQEQMQLDNLTCKDQAKLEANTAARQAGAFALGFTIVGAPLAFELEKAKQREVYKECMEKRGYRVLPPADGSVAANNPPSRQQPQLQPQPQPQPQPPQQAATPIQPPAAPKPTSLPRRDEAQKLSRGFTRNV